MKMSASLDVPRSASHERDQESLTQRQGLALGAGSEIGDRYTLTRELGRGASGVVFEAIHRFTQRRVAIKMTSSQSPAIAIGELRARLLREARALAAVRHPAIVDVLDGGMARDGTAYIVLELLEGARTLEGVLATRSPIPQGDAVAVALELCGALGAAHRAGVVHRDVKPGNVFIQVDALGRERVRLVDFGVARIHGRNEQRLTQTGGLVGTPEYMAPEQLIALEDVDHLADIYGLGVTLYQCLSGRLPYAGNYQQVLLQVMGTTAKAPPLGTICSAPKKLCAVVDRALSKERAHRQQSMSELAAELVDAAPGTPEVTSLLRPRTHAESVPPATLGRRRAPRAPYASPAQIVTSSGTFDGRTEDISEAGLLFIARERCEAAGRVAVRFALPIEGRVITCPAEVRWTRGGETSPRALGLEILALPEPARAQIAQYVSLMGGTT